MVWLLKSNKVKSFLRFLSIFYAFSIKFQNFSEENVFRIFFELQNLFEILYKSTSQTPSLTYFSVPLQFFKIFLL